MSAEYPTQPLPLYEERRSWVRRHKLLTGGLVVIGLLVAGAALGEDEGVRTTTATAPGAVAPAAPAAPPAPAAPRIGDPVRDGKLEFVVLGVRTPIPSVAPEPWTRRAQGQFVLVDVAVRNIADEPQVFTDGAQKAYVGASRLDADGWAGRLLEDNEVDWETVNPGNELRGTLVFDTPPGAVLTELDLHDSLFSGGVRVSLAG